MQIIISITMFLFFWIFFNIFDNLLFFSPVFAFYIPNDASVGFILTNIISIFLGILISMNIYVLKYVSIKLTRTTIIGAILGTVSSACVSCSSIGFLIISTFGTVGVLSTNFLSNFQIPLRILSILILILAIYSTHNKLTKGCIVNYNDENHAKPK